MFDNIDQRNTKKQGNIEKQNRAVLRNKTGQYWKQGNMR